MGKGREVRWVMASVLLEVDLHLHDLAVTDSPRSAHSAAPQRRPTSLDSLPLVESRLWIHWRMLAIAASVMHAAAAWVRCRVDLIYINCCTAFRLTGSLNLGPILHLWPGRGSDRRRILASPRARASIPTGACSLLVPPGALAGGAAVEEHAFGGSLRSF